MAKKFYQFWVYGRKEKLHKLTPEEIIHDLESDIANCREWSISPEELVKIISKPGFPESKANEIKEIILDYHSLCNREGITFGEELDPFIAAYCYHTITEKPGHYPKAKYRKSFLEKVIPWIETHYQSVKDADSGVFKDWEVDCLGNFHRYFGPDPVRWEYKIRKRFEKDFRILKTAAPETGN
ncbi:hypothetical protein IJH10_01070 [Candidatus Saccharibacteria bacterium]|nr:hypothetical protein [Candidatus Saccharibacteria bacterium]